MKVITSVMESNLHGLNSRRISKIRLLPKNDFFLTDFKLHVKKKDNNIDNHLALSFPR